MLAEQCDYTIDQQDADIVISAPYITCGITVKVNSTEDRKHQNTLFEENEPNCILSLVYSIFFCSGCSNFHWSATLKKKKGFKTKKNHKKYNVLQLKQLI